MRKIDLVMVMTIDIPKNIKAYLKIKDRLVFYKNLDGEIKKDFKVASDKIFAANLSIEETSKLLSDAEEIYLSPKQNEITKLNKKIALLNNIKFTVIDRLIDLFSQILVFTDSKIKISGLHYYDKIKYIDEVIEESINQNLFYIKQQGANQ